MDKRAFKNFITKRSSIWTISLCMTGILVLGGIAAVNQTRQKRDTQQETELDQLAYLEEEIGPTDDIEDALFPTLEDKMAKDMAKEASANGQADDKDAQTASADGQTDDTQTASVDGQADGTQTASSDGQTDPAQAVSANGQADGTPVVSAEGQDGMTTTSAAEASSSQIISEQALVAEGISFTDDNSLMWPAAGTILLDYSMDGSIYFPTLNQYKYNPAIVIGSDTGNQVLAAAKGIVESVYIDEETRNTLVLNIGGGYKLTYGQLKEMAVAQGDVVAEGALLGYVSEPTKYYSQEGSNLYFAMTQNDVPVDPVLYLE